MNQIKKMFEDNKSIVTLDKENDKYVLTIRCMAKDNKEYGTKTEFSSNIYDELSILEKKKLMRLKDVTNKTYQTYNI